MDKKSNQITDFLLGPSAADPLPIAPSDQMLLDTQSRNKAFRDILTTAGVAGAVGVGARGLMGARHFLGRPEADTSRSIGPQVLQIGTPVYTRKRDEERARLLGKQAFWKPWMTLPALMTAGIGGVYGGYKLTDHIMNNKRKSDLDAEIEEAKSKYRQALIGQYNPANVPSMDSSQATPALKMAALKDGLESMTRTVVECAETLAKKADWTDTGIGAAASLGGLLALSSGIAAYHLTKSRSPGLLLEKAIRQREKERWARKPPEIYAVPQPVHLNRGGDLVPSGEMPDLDNAPGLGR